jgi:hypothetical protein
VYKETQDNCAEITSSQIIHFERKQPVAYSHLNARMDLRFNHTISRNVRQIKVVPGLLKKT